MIIMTTTLPNPAALPEVPSTDRSLIAVLFEPLMVVGSVFFWALVLPLAAILRLSAGVYDGIAAVLTRIKQWEALRHPANPLLLRRGADLPETALASHVARQSV